MIKKKKNIKVKKFNRKKKKIINTFDYTRKL